MGSFVFTWPYAAEEVYVTGTFDNWSKSAKLDEVDGVFQKSVELPITPAKIYYKFVVDGEWVVDSAAPNENDESGNINNFLTHEDIVASAPAAAAVLSSAAPTSTTSALAKDVPLEEKADPVFTTPVLSEPVTIDPSTTGAESIFIASAAPTSTTADLLKDVPLETKAEPAETATATAAAPAAAVAPLELTEPAEPAVSAAVVSSAAPESTTAALAKDVPLEEPVAEKTATETPEEPSKTSDIAAPVAAAAAGVAAVGAAVTAAAKDTVTKPAMTDSSEIPGAFPETPAAELNKEIKLINPLPAAPGGVNPVKLAPGEPIPESLKTADINANVKLDPASYEKADAAIAGDYATESVPPVSKNLIPESSLPIAGGNDFHVNSAAPVATTAALAGAVPLEKKAVAEDAPAETAAVPEVVKESQKEAGVSPEASAIPEEVKEKEQVEEELLKKVPEAPATSEGTTTTSGTATTTAGVVGGITAAAAGIGAAAYATATSAKDKAVEQATPAIEQAATSLPVSVKQVLPAAVQEKIAATAATGGQPVSTDIPEEVKESLQESGASPEAAANAVAVDEKKAVESELLKKIAPVESAAEPSASAAEPAAAEPTAAASAAAAAPAAVNGAEPPITSSAAAAAPASIPTAAAAAASSAPAGTASSAPAGTATSAPSSTVEKKKKNRISSFFHKVFDSKKK